nr:FAD-dependent monooxygenase [Cypionkella sp.]
MMHSATRQETDILISGGGVAGLTAAAAFGSAGFRVICVDPTPPVTSDAEEGADLRTTAFLHPSIPVLEAAGLWSRLEPHAAALQVMRIIDAGGVEATPRIIKDFDAADLSDLPFGWNLPNWLLRREMVARLGDLPNVSFRPGTATTRMVTRQTEALVTLSDATTIRQALNIPVETIRYGQKALAFAVRHPQPHNNVSTEIHRSGGPFTLVPLPDRDGQPRSAVVWMETGANIARLQSLSVPEFEA